MAAANEQLNKAKEEIVASQRTLDGEKEKLAKAQEEEKDYVNQQEKLVNSLREQEDISAEQDKIIESKNEEIANIPQEIADLNQEVADKEAEKQELDQKIAESQEKVSEAERAKSEAESELEKAQAEYNKVKDSVKSLVSEEEKEKALEKWNKGSVGFFEENGSEEALAVFTDKDNEAKTYLKATREAGEKDARSLDRMRKAIQYIKAVNEKRQKDGGIDGRILSVLGITDFDMAVAQANINYSFNIREHAYVYNPPYENLAWGPETAEGALKLWWDEEKKLFDYLRTEKGLTSRTAMDEYIAKNSAEIKGMFGDYVNAVGHYLQLVDHLMWGNDDAYESKSIGYAVRPSDIFYDLLNREVKAHSMVLNDKSVDTVYSIEEYEKKFEAYYQDLKSKIDADSTLTPEDQQKLDKAQQALDAAQQKLDEKTKALEQAKAEQAKDQEAVKQLNKEIENCKKSISEKQQAQIDAQKAVTDAKAKKQEAESKVRELENQLNDLDNQHRETKTKLDALKEAVEKAQEIVDAKQTDVTAAEQDQQAKAKEVQTQEKLVDQMKEKQQALQTQLKEAEGTQQDTEKQLQEARNEKNQAEQALKAAAQKLVEKENSLETAQNDLDQTQIDLDQKNQALAEQQNNQKQVQAQYKDLMDLRDKKNQLDEKVISAQATVDELHKALQQNKDKLPEAQQKLEKAQEALRKVQAIDLEDEATYKDNFPELHVLVMAQRDAKAALSEAESKLAKANKDLQSAKADYDKARQNYQNKVKILADLLKKYPEDGIPGDILDNIVPSVELEVTDQEIDYSVIVRENPNLKLGERRVIQEGKKGFKRIFTEVTTYGDGRVKRVVLDYTADNIDPIDQIIEVGTKEVSKPEIKPDIDQEVNPDIHPEIKPPLTEDNDNSTVKPEDNTSENQTEQPSSSSVVATAQAVATLPQTGETNLAPIFSAAALSILAGLGLVVTREYKKEEHE